MRPTPQQILEMSEASKQIKAILQPLDMPQQLSVVSRVLFDLADVEGWSKDRLIKNLSTVYDMLRSS